MGDSTIMEHIIDKSQALSSLLPEGGWSLIDEDVFYHPEAVSEPTALEISNEVIRLQAVYDSQLYARTRKAKYDLLNQDEMRYDDLVNNTTTWRDGIAAIKTAHPKP